MKSAEQKLRLVRGELALAIEVVINSSRVVLMLYSDAGISAISSVPHAFSKVFTIYGSLFGVLDLSRSGGPAPDAHGAVPTVCAI